uniref:C2H2-type domain-containing protein n=1 Tax=Opuntia streptacantha TaxID=393608 RepID=A0A7C9DY13_OPUST
MRAKGGGHLLPHPLVAALAAFVLVSNNVGSTFADPYVYSSPPPPTSHHKSPPPVYSYRSPPPPPYPLPQPRERVVKVVGKVYCYRCYDFDNPLNSHDKKHLQGNFFEAFFSGRSCIFCSVGDDTFKVKVHYYLLKCHILHVPDGCFFCV